ncbi:MAG: FTR1 family protein [Gemmatimonadaceae bacterium]
MRTILKEAGAFLAVLLCAGALSAQEHPAKRLSIIVGVAVEEYAKGIDERGRTISGQEYQEAVGFLAGARDVAERLPGERANGVRAELDSLSAAVTAKLPPSQIVEIHKRFTAALGAEGALALPTGELSIATGRDIYRQSCASCHGQAGMGDGPAAKGMEPPPSAIGDAAAMADATPALLYRVISVGVPGTQMIAWDSTLTAQQRWEVVAYIQSLHATPSQVAEGERLFARSCASCRGVAGGLDGVVTRALSELPPEIGTFAWQSEHSDEQIAAVIRNGFTGSVMPGNARLSDVDVTRMVAYIRSLPLRGGVVSMASTTSAPADSGGARAARVVLARLDEALAAARSGRADEANDRGFDAYIAFEPLETPARARSPGIVAAMEQQFSNFRGALASNDLRAAEKARDAIELNMPSIIALTQPIAGRWAAFLQSLLIIVREGFEAILVVGAVVAFLIKTGNRDRLRSIWVGSALGLLASAATAVVLQTLLSAMPMSRDLVEGITMLVAVAVLFSVSYWLISKVEAAKWQKFIGEKVTDALDQGGGAALAFVAFLAVYREGAETALFYQALFGEGSHLLVPIVLGIVVGAAILALIFTLFYRYGVRIPLRPFFAVTSVLLYYMAFVFMGKGIRELQEVNAFPMTVLRGFPHVDAMGIYPTLETLLGQLLLVVLFIVALAKTLWPRRSVTLPGMPATPAVPTASDARRSSTPIGREGVERAVSIDALAESVRRLEHRIAELEKARRTQSSVRGEEPLMREESLSGR